MIFGLKVASKAFTIIYNAELGKSDALPNIWVETSREVTMVQRIEDLEKSERQFAMSCIEVIALAWKGADFPLVFHCMNGDKPNNVR